MNELKDKIKKIDCKLVKREDWEDTLYEMLQEETNFDLKFEDNILIVENKAQISHIEINGVDWFVSYNWVPLWRMHSWDDCFIEKWSDMFKTNLLKPMVLLYWILIKIMDFGLCLFYHIQF